MSTVVELEPPQGVRVHFGRPMFDEHEFDAVRAVLGGKCLTNGGNVVGFEEEFTDFVGGGMAVAVSSCMAGLHLCARYFLKPGDEAIVPALTHTATAHAIELAGARPVFVDVSPETGNMTPEGVESAITGSTKAIFPVHYLGRPVEMDRVMAIARPRGIKVIEDCALALGSFLGDKHVGLIGDAGCFSFYPVKHITTGEGGMVITKSPDLAEAIYEGRHFGQKHERGLGRLQAMTEVVSLGMNCRMTEMQAAIGREQLKKLPVFLEMREFNYRRMREHLADFEAIRSEGYSHYALGVYIDADNRQIKSRMRKNQVEVSIYYPIPVPLMPYYRKKYGYRDGMFPNSERIANRTVCFPVGPHLKKKAIPCMDHVFREALCASA